VTFAARGAAVRKTRRVIRVEDLVKRYKKADSNAVDGISFEAKAGEFFALLGPNGAARRRRSRSSRRRSRQPAGARRSTGATSLREAERRAAHGRDHLPAAEPRT
jgi:ABC-2 type transport system ATP-binding protein